MAAAPDLARGHAALSRIEGEAALGKSFALRATVAYKGAWVRLVRTFCEPAIARRPRSSLPRRSRNCRASRGFAGFRSWLVEGCRMAQPLDPLMGSRLDESNPPRPGALVSAQGGADCRWPNSAGRRARLARRERRSGKPVADPLFD